MKFCDLIHYISSIWKREREREVENERERERETNIIGNKNEHSLQKFSDEKRLYEIGRNIERDRKNNMLKLFYL